MATYAQALEALGDSTRRAIVERLREGPLAVGELAKGLPVSRPAAEHCVDADEYDRVAAGTQRWVVGLAATFFGEFTRHAVNLSVRRRRPPLSSTVDNPPVTG